MKVCRDQYWTWNCLSAHLCITRTGAQRDQYRVQHYVSIHASAYLLFIFPGMRYEAGQQKHEVHLSDWGQPALEWYKMLQIVRASLQLLETSLFTRELLKQFRQCPGPQSIKKRYHMGPFPQLSKAFVHLHPATPSVWSYHYFLMCFPVWTAQREWGGRGIGSSGELFSVNKRSFFPMGY